VETGHSSQKPPAVQADAGALLTPRGKHWKVGAGPAAGTHRALRGRRNPFVAREGIPWLLASLLACWLTYRYAAPAWVAVPAAVTALLYLVFRDPRRAVPAAPLGVVSPVDGDVVSVEPAGESAPAHRIVIRIDALGTYTARSPVEGRIHDLRSAPPDVAGRYPGNALWLQTDEGDDVALAFAGYRFGIPPRSFARYGERLGHGARCANLRLTRFAEVYLPPQSRVLVGVGERVAAGSQLIAQLPHP